MKIQKIKELVPLGLVLAALVYTTILVLMGAILLRPQHWLAYGLVLVVLVTFFLNKKISNMIFGATIVLGLLNLVSFTPAIVTIGAGISLAAMGTEVKIGIQPFSLLVLLTFSYAHRQAFMAWINRDGL